MRVLSLALCATVGFAEDKDYVINSTDAWFTDSECKNPVKKAPDCSPMISALINGCKDSMMPGLGMHNCKVDGNKQTSDIKIYSSVLKTMEDKDKGLTGLMILGKCGFDGKGTTEDKSKCDEDVQDDGSKLYKKSWGACKTDGVNNGNPDCSSKGPTCPTDPKPAKTLTMKTTKYSDDKCTQAKKPDDSTCKMMGLMNAMMLGMGMCVPSCKIEGDGIVMEQQINVDWIKKEEDKAKSPYNSFTTMPCSMLGGFFKAECEKKDDGWEKAELVKCTEDKSLIVEPKPMAIITTTTYYTDDKCTKKIMDITKLDEDKVEKCMPDSSAKLVMNGCKNGPYGGFGQGECSASGASKKQGIFVIPENIDPKGPFASYGTMLGVQCNLVNKGTVKPECEQVENDGKKVENLYEMSTIVCPKWDDIKSKYQVDCSKVPRGCPTDGTKIFSMQRKRFEDDKCTKPIPPKQEECLGMDLQGLMMKDFGVCFGKCKIPDKNTMTYEATMNKAWVKDPNSEDAKQAAPYLAANCATAKIMMSGKCEEKEDDGKKFYEQMTLPDCAEGEAATKKNTAEINKRAEERKAEEKKSADGGAEKMESGAGTVAVLAAALLALMI